MNRALVLTLGLLLTLVLSPVAPAPLVADPYQKVLPPLVPWDGKSRELVVPEGDPWITPCEESGLTRTPRYDETEAWLRKLVDAAPELRMVSLGDSPEGRAIWMVIASTEEAFTSDMIRASDKGTVLAHSGIHSGEIDGKDAGLMLLRDMTVRGTKRELLDEVNFLFVPIFSVDAHERYSEYGRINQRGPIEKGWRTNSRNLNLNRDYSKLDMLEMRHMIGALREYEPDLYLDLHVTDGVDYQYDITYGYNKSHAWSPHIAGWLDEHYRTTIDAALEEYGHIPGPLIFGANGRDMYGGMWDWTASPRFSNGYGDARHLPTVLVENHSLKPYDQRVLGTYVLLEATLRLVAEERNSLQRATRSDLDARPAEIPLSFQVANDRPPRTISFKGITSETFISPISGNVHVRWLGQPEDMEILILETNQAQFTATRPKQYLIPAAWSDVAEVMQLHGIAMTRIESWETRTCEMLRLPEASMDDDPFEGRGRVTPGEPVPEIRDLALAPGSYVVNTDQPLGELVMLLLEPLSPDSFLQWGFFLPILNRTEYFEAYAIEPMARMMLDEDPELEKEFRQKLLGDSEFAGSARMRLEWFYERTPFYDDHYKLYPIGRVIE